MDKRMEATVRFRVQGLWWTECRHCIIVGTHFPAIPQPRLKMNRPNLKPTIVPDTGFHT